MAGFSINYGTTENIKHEMVTAQQKIREYLTNLETAIKNNLDEENWVQTCKDVYTEVQRKWTSDCDDLNTVLGNAHVVLGDIMDNFLTVDKMGRDTFMQVGI
jgi:uncharacterized protein YukE